MLLIFFIKIIAGIIKKIKFVSVMKNDKQCKIVISLYNAEKKLYHFLPSEYLIRNNKKNLCCRNSRRWELKLVCPVGTPDKENQSWFAPSELPTKRTKVGLLRRNSRRRELELVCPVGTPDGKNWIKKTFSFFHGLQRR